VALTPRSARCPHQTALLNRKISARMRSAARDQHDGSTRLTREARRHLHDSEVNTPMAAVGDREDTGASPPQHWMAGRKAFDVAMRWLPLTCEMWPTARRSPTWGECMVMWQEAGEVRGGPPMRSKCDDAHVLDRRIGEQPLMNSSAAVHDARRVRRLTSPKTTNTRPILMSGSTRRQDDLEKIGRQP